ncbi:MAG: PspC domain-containing protein [Nocardioidaceae bacterium]|nr:PspC domain-containing protein [Nocardioidaceae bacterium]
MSEQNPQPQQAARRLTRSLDDSMIAGVCGGLARYAGVDPTLVRIIAVVALFVGFPAVFMGYVVGWVIMPKA